MSSRIGRGPWARALGAALVPDDATPEAINGEELWRRGAVEDLRIDVGHISARVDGCKATLTAPTIPPRIWAAMVSYARNRGPVEKAVRGELQSLQLQHLLAQDWDEPLVPTGGGSRSCSCHARPHCEHLAALAHATAHAIDGDPSLLLRWRGSEALAVDEVSPGRSPAPRGEIPPEPWVGGPPSTQTVARSSGSVAKRLGASGIRVGQRDLADVLDRAYQAFGTSRSGDPASR